MIAKVLACGVFVATVSAVFHLSFSSTALPWSAEALSYRGGECWEMATPNVECPDAISWTEIVGPCSQVKCSSGSCPGNLAESENNWDMYRDKCDPVEEGLEDCLQRHFYCWTGWPCEGCSTPDSNGDRWCSQGSYAQLFGKDEHRADNEYCVSE